MSYSFKVMSEEELNDLLPEGVYDFEITKSTRKVSKSGNDMAELNISVWDKNGKVHYLRDWLVFTNIALNIRKIKHFCESVKLPYEKGELPEDLCNLSGKLKVGINDEQPKADGGYWPKKNVVMDYVKFSGAANTSVNKKNDKPEDGFNDDVPF